VPVSKRSKRSWASPLRRRSTVLALAGGLCLAALPAASAHAAKIETVNEIATISYAPNSYIIGNAYAGWTDVIQGNPEGGGNGLTYRWGYLYGPRFDACAWIGSGQSTATQNANDMCGTPQQQDTPYFVATYTDGTVSPGVSDGSPTTRTGAAGCGTGYGNVEPWEVPATPGSPRTVASTDNLLWRYVSKDGNWVMVRDTDTPSTQGNPGATIPNWFFMPRDCLNLLD
jgi:hypothetical protein